MYFYASLDYCISLKIISQCVPVSCSVSAPVLPDPVREDVSHRTTLHIEADVEAIRVNLRTVGDSEHRLEPDALLPCKHIQMVHVTVVL